MASIHKSLYELERKADVEAEERLKELSSKRQEAELVATVLRRIVGCEQQSWLPYHLHPVHHLCASCWPWCAYLARWQTKKLFQLPISTWKRLLMSLTLIFKSWFNTSTCCILAYIHIHLYICTTSYVSDQVMYIYLSYTYICNVRYRVIQKLWCLTKGQLSWWPHSFVFVLMQFPCDAPGKGTGIGKAFHWIKWSLFQPLLLSLWMVLTAFLVLT